MYTLFMVFLFSYGGAATGGPIIKDGFKTEVACYAYAEKLKKNLHENYDRGGGILGGYTKNSVEQITCIKIE